LRVGLKYSPSGCKAGRILPVIENKDTVETIGQRFCKAEHCGNHPIKFLENFF
jgi:hypothetical protein